MAGMSIGPAITGIIIEASGYNYGMIFVVQAVTALLAFLALFPVKKGEMRVNPKLEENAG